MSNFDESKINRARDGKFATKTSGLPVAVLTIDHQKQVKVLGTAMVSNAVSEMFPSITSFDWEVDDYGTVEVTAIEGQDIEQIGAAIDFLENTHPALVASGHVVVKKRHVDQRLLLEHVASVAQENRQRRIEQVQREAGQYVGVDVYAVADEDGVSIVRGLDDDVAFFPHWDVACANDFNRLCDAARSQNTREHHSSQAL
ncbi:hypothetical protein [Actinomyces vulturis]|uniref:hypothetical protein n=1 Tax=Actinomyces vulturis TaxID=1857645 RepID=UPI00082D3191|nr:hypothetical protein [Actinomyces vulturis]